MTFNWGDNNTNNNNNSNAGGWSFGSTTQNNNSGFNFGSNNSNNNNNNNLLTFDNSSNNNNNNNFDNPLPKIKKLFNEYNPNTNECRFESILYNKIPKNSNKNNYIKPPNVRTQLWEYALKNNPNPKELIPVCIKGYNELNERSKLCLAGHISTQNYYNKISNKIDKIKHDINNKIKQKIIELKETQINLSNRLLIILREYIVKITNNYKNNNNNNNYNNTFNNDLLFNDNSLPLNRNEIQLKNTLQTLLTDVKLLQKNFYEINELTVNFNNNNNITNNNNNNYGYNIFNNISNDKNIDKLYEFLDKNTKLLKYLTQTVHNDLNDLDVILKGMNSVNNIQYL